MYIVRVFNCKSVNFVAGLQVATDEGSLPEIAQYSQYYFPLNVLLLPKDQQNILFAITAAGVVPSCGPKKYPCTSSRVQIIFFFRSLEISSDIQSVQNTYV